MNHRAICIVLEAFGFQAADINLIRRMYSGRDPFHQQATCTPKQLRAFENGAFRKEPGLVVVDGPIARNRSAI